MCWWEREIQESNVRGREQLDEARNQGQSFQKIKDNNISIREEMFLKGL